MIQLLAMLPLVLGLQVKNPDIREDLGKYCYTTKHKIFVYQYHTECPKIKKVERITRKYLRKQNKPKHYLKGLTVIFSKVRVQCSKALTMGCHIKNKMFVVYGVKWDWIFIYKHELCHEDLYRQGVHPLSPLQRKHKGKCFP